MREMTIKEIQDASLAVLRHIDAFCRQHGIQYFLEYGTLLGAARHNGFIPWDDDADIAMPRPDYERFLKEFLDTPKYKLFAPEKGNSYLHYARVCEMQRTYFQSKNKWTSDSPGVGVDVFPLNGAPNTAYEYDAIATEMIRARNYLWRLRAAKSHRMVFRTDVYGFAKDIVHWCANKYREARFQSLATKTMNKIFLLEKKIDYDKSEKCFLFAMANVREQYLRGYVDKQLYSDVVYHDFCGQEFPMPIGWETRLALEYGDWRIPPPESKRMGHTTNQTMYWRE